MDRNKAISGAVIRRLPKYYRIINFIHSKGIVRISSQNLSEITGFTASQIRQDFNHFGGFGQQGYGYNVNNLRTHIARIIGLHKHYNIVIVGAGHLGQAICRSYLFQEKMFRLMGVFDSDPEKVGMSVVDDVNVYDAKDLGRFIQEEHIDIVVITTPRQAAQEIADTSVAAGVRGIWNFAPVDIKLPKNIVLENVHLDESLYALIYYIGNLKDYKG